DSSTAVIADEATDFTVATGAIADGSATNAVSAKVTDAKGNPVVGVDVTFAVATGDARFGSMAGEQSVVVKTTAGGIASTTLVSEVAGNNDVTARVGSKTTAAKVSSFVADSSTAVIADEATDFTVATGAIADGSA
ncbi:Ig-like domain-containing protein, partial [Escherichia coli]|uniref:Ig-like domain-containing protein n=1 Tax=Escherichia coli TaxID=562 RepID=UPI003BA06222